MIYWSITFTKNKRHLSNLLKGMVFMTYSNRTALHCTALYSTALKWFQHVQCWASSDSAWFIGWLPCCHHCHTGCAVINGHSHIVSQDLLSSMLMHWMCCHQWSLKECCHHRSLDVLWSLITKYMLSPLVTLAVQAWKNYLVYTTKVAAKIHFLKKTSKFSKKRLIY